VAKRTPVRVRQRIGDCRRNRIDGALRPGTFAPKGPIVSWVSAKNTSVRGTSAKLGMRVIAQRRVHHRAGVVDHVLGQRPAEAHGDRAVDLARDTAWVDQPADIGGMDAVQDADSAVTRVDREAHALDVECHRARREVSLALCFEAVPGLAAGDMQVGESDPLRSADQPVAVQPTVADRHDRCDGWRIRRCCCAAPVRQGSRPVRPRPLPVLAKVPVS